jgi:hypothetical protein
VTTVGADDDPSSRFERSLRGVPLYPHDAVALVHERVDRHPLCELGPRLDRGVDEDLVEHVTAWGREAAAQRALKGDLEFDDLAPAHVEAGLGDGRAVRLEDLVGQAPSDQAHHPGGVDEVGRHRVAREPRPIDDQNSVPGPGEQHGQGRSGAAGSHDHGVVHGLTSSIAALYNTVR